MAASDEDERQEELESLAAIYPELVFTPDVPFSATLELAVTPAKPVLVRFVPDSVFKHGNGADADAASRGSAHVERDVELSHLPPLCLQITLPARYPAESPPKIHLSTQQDWLPAKKLKELAKEARKLWEEYGGCQILFVYIDFLQQAAESGLDVDQSLQGCLTLSASQEPGLVAFDQNARLSRFNQGTFDCGICLEPKKGSSCYQMMRCGHVFCLQCLQDFYNNAITEGDIASVRCLDPTCGKDSVTADGRKRKRKTERTVHPRELLAMRMEASMVRRYVEMKRKKKMEADKTVVYCPRTWCQGAARCERYPPIPEDLATVMFPESSSDEEEGSEEHKAAKHDLLPTLEQRLAVCEKCKFAFCRVCFMGWHGSYQRCYPRDPNNLSEEEKASYEYIRLNTSPCPTCSSPTQKTMGCNHMKCFQCSSHFCYLCGAWLIQDNPYQHFNKAGTKCYQRLWELEGGDEGQAPQNGGGVAGGRGWEQMALEVARAADEQEAADAAARAVAVAPEPLANAIAQIQLNEDQQQAPAPRPPNRGGRAPRNPFPAHPPAAAGVANVVRNHERGGRPGRNARRLSPHEGDRRQQELQRFLEMAQRDEEDAWDSDELGDEERFEIR